MLERGRVYIIPNENKLKIPNGEFTMNIHMNHLEAIQNFCDRYQLGYHFSSHQYQEAPCILALDGNFVIKTLEDMHTALFYLPSTISEQQLTWFFSHFDLLSTYKTIEASMISGDKNDLHLTPINGGLDSIYRWMNVHYSHSTNYSHN